MNTVPKQKIVILLTNHYAVLNVIHSGLLKSLANEVTIEIWSTFHFDTLTIPDNVSIHTLTPIKESWIQKALRQLLKGLFYEYHKTATYQFKKSKAKGWGKYSYSFITYLTKFSSFTRFLMRVLRRYTQHVHKRKLPLFPKHITGIISTSPFDIQEAHIVLNAPLHVRKLAIPISWDNLTTKGVLLPDYHTVFVWNNIMKQEFEQLYALFPNLPTMVEIVGIPRFRHHLPALSVHTSPTILLATSAPIHYGENVYLIRLILHYILERRLNITLHVRLHPADNIDNYEGITSDLPITWSQGTHTANNHLPADSFITNLVKELQQAKVCLHIASTIRLEALLCGIPTIGIGFGSSDNSTQNVQQLYQYSHQKALAHYLTSDIVTSEHQLWNKLDEYLIEPLQSSILKLPHQVLPTTLLAPTINAIKKWLH